MKKESNGLWRRRPLLALPAVLPPLLSLRMAAAQRATTPAPPAGASTSEVLRAALIVGNQRYGQAPLVNAVNDARSVGAALSDCGFGVEVLTDASRTALLAALERLGRQLQGRQGVGLFYFAGHGLQVDWRNYMLPVDARIETAAEVPPQCVEVQEVLDRFGAAGNRVNIVILDACRDNPFPRAGSARGLAPMDAPAGTFLAYATAPGNVAEDGRGSEGSGPYARFLVQELRRPETGIESVFKRVRFEVRRLTEGRQIPWESTSLVEDFSFRRGLAVAAGPADPAARDRAFERELADWERIRNATAVDEYYAHLLRYPEGMFSELAQARVDRLQRAQALPAQAPGRLPAIDVARRRYELGDVVVWEVEDQLRRTSRTSTRRVTAVDDERVEFNGGRHVLTQSEGRLRDGHGDKWPPIVEVASDMAVGRRWRTAFIQSLGGRDWRNFYDSRVAALEDLLLPIGAVRCYRVEHRGESAWPDGRVELLSRMTWVDASFGQVMRRDHEFRWAQGRGNSPGRVHSLGSERVVALRMARR